jgi:hypothetical protein
MKRALRSIALALALVLVAPVAVIATTGCATGATVQRKAFVTLSDVAEGARTGMLAFNSRYQAGLQTEAQRVQVLAAYAKYQKSMLLAESVAKDITQNANALQIANDAVAPLLDLIASLQKVAP